MCTWQINPTSTFSHCCYPLTSKLLEQPPKKFQHHNTALFWIHYHYSGLIMMYFLSLTVKATIGKNLTSVELARSLITFIIIFRDLRDEPNGLKLQGSKRTGALAVRSPPRSTIMQPKLTLKPILIACQLRPDVSIKHVTWGSALLISWSLQEQIYTFLHPFYTAFHLVADRKGSLQWPNGLGESFNAGCFSTESVQICVTFMRKWECRRGRKKWQAPSLDALQIWGFPQQNGQVPRWRRCLQTSSEIHRYKGHQRDIKRRIMRNCGSCKRLSKDSKL